MIKYKYGLNSFDAIVNVNDLNKISLSRDVKFSCISCGKELIPRLGKQRQKHFAHKIEGDCNEETYLHVLGKKIFYNEYTKCLENKTPFILEYLQQNICLLKHEEFGVTCKLNKSPLIIDLTQYFHEIKIELRDGSFIPDILLLNSENNIKLYFEIAVTHFITENKKHSGFRIIELTVKNENDFQAIQKNTISYLDSNIKLFNFKQKINKPCENECLIEYDIFIVFQNGKSVLISKSLTELSKYSKEYNDRIRYFEISKYSRHAPEKYKYLVSKTFLNDNVHIKNCFICKFHTSFPGNDRNKLSIYCDKLERVGNSNDAARCAHFKPDNLYIQGHIESWENNPSNK